MQVSGAVNMCMNLDDKDYIVSTYRGYGHCIAKGGEVPAITEGLSGKSGVDAVVRT
jgi:acetoin:2,6-dichlorophenolindophenol oxidoreductase subunit alpha